ncbi:transposase [Mycobacterium ulcerans]|uniref:transposase n=1 Tax=Mycobacterium ulcerans TaxID=1809 RepID=UPI003F4FB7E6
MATDRHRRGSLAGARSGCHDRNRADRSARSARVHDQLKQPGLHPGLHPSQPGIRRRGSTFLSVADEARGVADRVGSRSAESSLQHWGIENSLHWIRDVTFDEDRQRAHTGNGAQVLATLRNTAINLHRLNGADNIAEACRITALTANRRLDLLNPQFPSSQAC